MLLCLKESMYHFFNSKKDLLYASIQERISPKVVLFFDFTSYPNKTLSQTLERIFVKMSTYHMLIKQGCPLHRLIVEVSHADKNFEQLLMKDFDMLVDKLSILFEKEISQKRMHQFDTKNLARFMITSIWGEISLPPSRSSKKSFLAQTNFLLKIVQTYKIRGLD